MHCRAPRAAVTENPLQGGCLCGAVRYEITAPFITARYCHCTRCQRRTGTASSANGLVPSSGFRLLSGRRTAARVRAAGRRAEALLHDLRLGDLQRRPVLRRQVVVRLGALDGDPGIRPQYRQFVDFAAPWEPIPDDGLERFRAR